MVFKVKKILVLFFIVASINVFAQKVGVLYGMSYQGYSAGTLFSYDPLTGKDTALVDFTALGFPGAGPRGSLIQANDGMLYGMASANGAHGVGVLFSYNVYTNTYTDLFDFNSSSGENPYGTLMQANDGNLYGMTTYGGQYNDGTLFSYNIGSGNFNVLINFNDTNGNGPFYGALAQDKNGLLYGATRFGGAHDSGVLFSYNPVTTKDSVLYSFTGSNVFPYSCPIVGLDGNIYGMTHGDNNYNGAIYVYNTTTGRDSILFGFLPNNGSNGWWPYGSLLQTPSGLFYGMTYYQFGAGGPTGTLFSYALGASKDSICVSMDTSSGCNPYGTPMMASNGLIYGLTYSGGPHGYGKLFCYNPANGKDSALINFNGYDAQFPYGDMVEAFTYTVTGLDTLKCYGDSNGWVRVSSRGGKAPVRYAWNNGATTDSIGHLGAGEYVCTISDTTGKQFTIQAYILQPGQLVSRPVVNNACTGNNDSAWAGVFGGTLPYTFLWSNGATTDTIRGLPPGNDTCRITDLNGCRAVGTIVVANPAPLKIDSVRSTRTSCDTCIDGTATVYVSGGVPPGDSTIGGYQLIYLWTYGGDSATVHGLPSGVDSVTVSNECGSVIGYTEVPAGIATINSPQNLVKIYPVPTSGKVTLLLVGKGFQGITISDELGREVYNQKLDAQAFNYTMHPDLCDQLNGLYIVQLYTEAGIITRRLVIQK